MIGIQADKFSGIAKRIYNEGNTIGNHTFTHPDISNISDVHVKVELNLTERLFASLLGVRATLMRPPYAIDEEPDTADQVRPLEIPQEMGYITVGNRIDPNDWSDKPTAERISSYVLSHLPPCKQENLRCASGRRTFRDCGESTGGIRRFHFPDHRVVSSEFSLELFCGFFGYDWPLWLLCDATWSLVCGLKISPAEKESDATQPRGLLFSKPAFWRESVGPRACGRNGSDPSRSPG